MEEHLKYRSEAEFLRPMDISSDDKIIRSCWMEYSSGEKKLCYIGIEINRSLKI
ncbi:MAG: hypothetical protein NT007_10105 [Candidatus Kapabacteria bacterium]|nr:hypothetical protein [Candidatus Kapabacteria bacterium]